MSKSNADELTDSDFDPDEEYGNLWPGKHNESKNDGNTSEESENEGIDDQDDCGDTTRTTPSVLKELTRNCIQEIYQILDAHKQASFKNALELNKEMQNKLIMIRTQIQTLHSKVLSRYAQNEQRLINSMCARKDYKKMGIFGTMIKGRTFYIRGNTFFKDENMRNCPNNEDYVERSKRGEVFPMDFELVARHIWAITDKMAIVNGIKEQIIVEKSLHIRISNNNTQLRTLLENVGKDFQIDWTLISSHYLGHRHSPTSCKAMWDVYLHPEIKHDNFSSAENERLLKAAEKYNFQNWRAIAKEVGKRSDYQCFLHYHTSIINRGRWQRWDKRDDNRLLAAIEASKCNGVINWVQVAFQFPQKSKASLQQRYQYTIKPSVSHEPFTAEEDLLLLAAVKEYGTNFAKLPRTLFPNRSVVQLRSRYNNTLQYRDKNVPWTLEDDKFLMNFVEANGIKSWKKLEEAFEYRHSRIMCRQRYYVIKKALSKDANATLENMVRKPVRVVRSDITLTNWQQRVEDLRINPANSQDLTNAELSNVKKRKRKTTEHEKKPAKKQSKMLNETENENSLNNGLEALITEDTLSNTDDQSNESENKSQPTADAVADLLELTNAAIRKTGNTQEEPIIRLRKKPPYLERLRMNGLIFHDFFKYSYNFRFGRRAVADNTNYMIEIEKAKDCLGFQMPKDPCNCLKRADIGHERSLNGLLITKERYQRLTKFIRDAVKPGTTLEPTDTQIPPNFSTLATLRAFFVLSTDLVKRKETASKNDETSVQNTTKAIKPITTENAAAIERFRQRFRNLFYQAAVLSRLPPSSLVNSTLKTHTTIATEYHRPIVEDSERMSSPLESLDTERMGSPFESMNIERMSSPLESVDIERMGSPFESVDIERMGSPFESMNIERMGSPLESVDTERMGNPVVSVNIERVLSPVESMESIKTETAGYEEPMNDIKTEIDFEAYKETTQQSG